MKLWPFRRRQRHLNPGGEAVLVRDVDQLAGDETMDLGSGLTIRVADLLDSLDSGADIPVHRDGEAQR